MDDTQLQSLLRQADADAPLPAADLVIRVRRRQAALRTRNRVLGGMVILLVTVTAIGMLFYATRPTRTVVKRDPPKVTTKPSATIDVEQLRREIAMLDREAAAHEEAALGIVATEHADRARRSATQVRDVQLTLERERYDAAMRIIRDADDLLLRRREPRPAADAYRRVITLFPSTYWATVAQERLARLGTSGQRGMTRPADPSKPVA
jgi:uncharacterized protein (DUF849 family)